jgi:excisionase family DNA binding protein
MRPRTSTSATLDAVNTIEEVATFAKVSPRTVTRAIAAGNLEALRAGSQLRITDRAVWAWLEAGQK